ncbi:hypothetical protein B2J93_3243 [Marssonina coronariae]|uniref:Uncharacterized protein n=1 Tax=Diplocarpon coronariae TaxID=2795749 RepID=A0A218Z779_9HELO|nr:hypothetical protein B2J93_3243 [Marssonina coronariae]
MARVLGDPDNGECKMPGLLSSLPNEVLEALILNTIGPGIYINTIILSGRGGKSVSRLEWEEVRVQIKLYMGGQEVAVGDSSNTIYRQTSNTAKDIERTYGTRRGDPNATAMGVICFLNAWRHTGMLLDVGSKLSTVKALGMSPGPFIIPFPKFRENDTVSLGEALVSMLGQTAVHDGDYHPSRIGTGESWDFDELEGEETRVLEDGTLNENLTAAETEIRNRLRWLRGAGDLDSQSPLQTIKDLEADVPSVEMFRVALDTKLQEVVPLEQ